jgi:RNA polymerase subunit RPABC4/transcription elongation factor Spt4
MAWPWYCRTCAKWREGKYEFCAECGRHREGRICRRCRKEAENDDIYCPHCGSSHLSEPVEKGRKPPRPARFGYAVLLFAGIWLLIRALAPLMHRLGSWLLCLFLCLAWRVFLCWLVFWLVTGLLPKGLREALRGAVWRIARLAGRLVVRLVE